MNRNKNRRCSTLSGKTNRSPESSRRFYLITVGLLVFLAAGFFLFNHFRKSAYAQAGGEPTYRQAMDILKKNREQSRSLYTFAYASTSTQNGGLMSVRQDGFADVIHGDVHTNGALIFGSPGQTGAVINGNATAVNGIGRWMDPGGDPWLQEGNLNGGAINGESDGHVNPLNFPTAASFTTDLQATADDYPNYFIHWSNPLYAPYKLGDDGEGGNDPTFNLQITLLGTQIKIDFFTYASGSTPAHTVTLPLPAHKLLWLDGTAGVKGNLNGRLTIVATGGFGFSGHIRYVDNEGDRAYVLKKNGAVVEPEATGTESWTAANGYTYEPNPAHNPNAPCNLTLQTFAISLPTTGPYNLEIHAVMLSWYFSCGYVPNINQGNLRMVGSVVPVAGRNDADANNYYRLSVEVIYDPNLQVFSPEWYPGVANAMNFVWAYPGSDSFGIPGHEECDCKGRYNIGTKAGAGANQNLKPVVTPSGDLSVKANPTGWFGGSFAVISGDTRVGKGSTAYGSISFEIAYNSREPNGLPESPLGPNWTHNFNQRLIITTTSTSLIHRMPDGQRVTYVKLNGYTTNYWIPQAQAGEDNLIYQNPATLEYTFISKDRMRLYFYSTGRMKGLADELGNKIDLFYTGANLTSAVLTAGGAGQTISIAYSGNLISGVTDPSGLTSFTYTGGKLTSISQTGGWHWSWTYHPGTNLIATQTDPKNQVTSFQYTGNPLKLTGITNAAGQQKTIAYNEATFGITITDYNGETSRLKYSPIMNAVLEFQDELTQTHRSTLGTLRQLTKSFDPLGGQNSLVLNRQGNVLTRTNEAGFNTVYRYEDPNHPTLPTRIIDELNVTTYFEYNATGQPTRTVAAMGTSVEQETTYEYDTYGRLKKQTRDPLGLNLVTEYYYDPNGYMNKKVVDQTGLNIVYESEFNILGQVIKTFDPRYQPAKTVWTEYQYDSRGNQTSIIAPTREGGTVTTKLEYDLNDNLIKRTEDYGGLNPIITTYTYDNLNRLTDTIIDPSPGLNIATHTDYDNEGQVTKVTDPENATTEYFYYDNNRLFQAKRLLNDNPSTYAITEYKYDANGNQTEVKDPEGHTTTTTYDVLNRPLTITDPISNTITYHYPNCGCSSADWVQDARGNKTYSYTDELKRLKYVRTPESNITTAYVYDKAGRTLRVIGPWKDDNQNGIADDADSADISYNEYDKADRVTRTYTNSHPATEFYYDKNGDKTINWVKSPIDATTFQITESHSDRAGRLQMTVVDPDALNERTYYVYDSLGRQIEVIAGYGSLLPTSTYSEYDKANRLIYSRPFVNNNTYATKYDYNKRGQQTRVYDAEGLAANPQYYTEYQYDKGGRLLKVINAKGGNNYTRYGYDKDGNRTDVWYVKNSAEVNTHYTYYNNHLLHTTTYPGFAGPNTTINVYDGNGNLISKEDAKGQIISYGYDLNNRLTSKSYTGYSAAYTYDAESNLLTTTVNGNPETTNTYDDLDRLETVTNNPLNKTIAYTYYEDGTRKSIDGPEAADLIDYTYDKAKRLLTVKRNSVIEGTYEYNALGLRTKLTKGNGSYTENTYDTTTRWLTGVYNKKSDSSIISSFAYTHDKIGNRKTMTLANGDILTYGFDTIYQLTSEVRTGTTAYNIAWTYDEVGNRLTQNKNGTLTTNNYNDANQLLDSTTAGLVTNYQYDANGNQTGKTEGANTWTWGYDFENRQVSYDDPLPTNDASYTYDASGTRIAKTVNGVTEKYIHDGANVICDYDGVNTLKATYVTPFLDQNLLMVRGGNTYYYDQDGLGSVRELTDAGQVTQNTYDYYAFGEALNWSETVENRYTYTAREWDAESQTNHYRIRQQDPRTGRFLSADPIGYDGGINLYTYALNSPVTLIDKWGLAPSDPEKVKRIQEIVGTNVDGYYGIKTNEAVKRYQKLLKELGYYKTNIDGDWGVLTEKAHQEYEKSRPKPEGVAFLIGGRRITKAEERLAKKNDQETIAVGLIVTFTYLETKKYFPNATGQDDIADAFRHCFWSCMMTMTLGDKKAKEWNDAHENFPDNPAASRIMDEYNNAIGRKLGKNQNCLKDCYCATQDCRLMWLDKKKKK